MTGRTLTGIVLLVLAQGVAGCGGPDPFPSPSPVPQSSLGGPRFSTLTGVTLYGVVFEVTPTGNAPIEGVAVYCEPCGEATHTFAYTDANGYYSFSGDLSSGGGVWLSAGHPTRLNVTKTGYELMDPDGTTGNPPWTWKNVTINGDTRFDIELVRR